MDRGSILNKITAEIVYLIYIQSKTLQLQYEIYSKKHATKFVKL